jgi:hypothetical protein
MDLVSYFDEIVPASHEVLSLAGSDDFLRS